jgi:hypothetical protein
MLPNLQLPAAAVTEAQQSTLSSQELTDTEIKAASKLIADKLSLQQLLPIAMSLPRPSISSSELLHRR